MSSFCSTSRNSGHGLWFFMVIATLIGCGMFLYLSYLYRGSVKESCDNCIKNVNAEKLTQANCPNLCSSKECVSAANVLLENMDVDVEPCDDFYSFSCGNWVKRFSKDDNYSVINGMEMALKVSLKDLLDNLNEPMKGTTQKLKVVYDSCLNDNTSEFKAVPTVKEYLDKVGIRGWPHLPQTFEFADSSMERTLGRLAAYDEFAFLRFHFTEDEVEQNNSLHRFNLTIRPAYPLMIDDSKSEFYETVVHKVMRYFGVDTQKANRTWKNFRKIDIAVLKLYVESSSAVHEVPDYQETLQYLNCTSESSDNLVQICNTLKHFVEYIEIGTSFYDDRAYIVKSLLMENILPLIKNFTQREVANYLALRFIVSHLDVLSILFRSILLSQSHPEAYSTSTDFKGSAIQWEQCVGWVSYHMSFAVGQEFVSRKLSTDQLEEMHSIVRIYIQEAGIYVSNQKWISENNRKQLQESLGGMKNNMEYFVNVLFNGSILNSLLEEFNPTNQSFLQNVLEYRKHILRLVLLNYKAMEYAEFPFNFFTVNAYHSYGIIDPRIGMFFPPVYQYGLPKLLNLATMGTVIGHEIGHEIVLLFSYYEILDEAVNQVYHEKRKCLEEQYSAYEIKKIGKMVKGNETINENLSDLIGIEITQQVIEKYSQEKNEDYEVFELPALNFSSEQILYISLAQFWCSVKSKEKEQHHLESDAHAPYDIRISGMLKNLREFSEVFNCSSNSNMNLHNRCSIRE